MKTADFDVVREAALATHNSLSYYRQMMRTPKGEEVHADKFYGKFNAASKYIHELKSWSMFFKDILTGERTSDIRWTGDRRFHVGDELLLKEFDPVAQTYTGRVQTVEITYIQQNKSNPCAISHKALADDYAVLSIRKVEPQKQSSLNYYKDYSYD